MNIQRVDYCSKTAPHDFTQSVHETGFVVLTNHPVKEKELKDFYAAWEEFFKKSPEDKEWFRADEKRLSGWIPGEKSKTSTVYDIKEFFNFRYWGYCPSELRAMTDHLYHKLLSIADNVLGWLDEQTPAHVSFSEPLAKMIQNTTTNLFRINYYPPLTGDEKPGALRAAEHEDIDLITVLTAGTQDGLQAQDKKGQWNTVPAEHGNLVINIGDMLQEASGGYYPSTTHRVLNPTGDAMKKTRMSCPLFVHPRDEVVLSERHTSKSYCAERMIENGLVKNTMGM